MGLFEDLPTYLHCFPFNPHPTQETTMNNLAKQFIMNNLANRHGNISWTSPSVFSFFSNKCIRDSNRKVKIQRKLQASNPQLVSLAIRFSAVTKIAVAESSSEIACLDPQAE